MKAHPLTAADISVKQVEEGPTLQIRACLHLTVQIDVDPADLRRFPEHRGRILEEAEGEARTYLAERIHGKVKADARRAYETLRNFILDTPHLNADFAKALRAVFDPLLHAGSELVILQKELAPERFDMERQIATEAK